MNTIKIENAIKMLSLNEDKVKKDYNYILNTKNSIIKAGFEKIIFNNDFKKACTILKLYGYKSFMTSSLTYDEYEKLFRKISKRNYNLFLKNIKMKEDRYLDESSYISMMQQLSKSQKYLKKMDDDRSKIVIDKKKDVVGGASLTEILILDPRNKFMVMASLFLNDKKLTLKNIATLKELLSNIMYTDISKDYNKFKALSNEIFRIIKRNFFKGELLEDIKVELRDEIKSYEDSLERIRNKNKVVENKEFKLGDRKERINEYKKDKLKQEIKRKKSSLSSESKLWIDILVDQLLAFDKDMINNFKTDYESYLPVENNDINEIVDVVIKQLEYKDAAEDVIDTLKGVNL